MKLFIADIDGTLRSKGSMIPGPLTRQAFEEMHQEGMILGIASGRPLWQGVTNHHTEWGLSFQFDFLIGMNGGEIWTKDTNERKEYNLLSTDTLKEIVTALHHFAGINPFVYRQGSELSLYLDEATKRSGVRHGCPVFECKEEADLYSEPTAKILYRCDTVAIADEVETYARQYFGSRIACFKTGPELVELQLPQVNKGEGLKLYCQPHHIDLKDVIAFGDAENDIEMLKIAGTSVCLKDSMDDAKAASNFVTDYDCDEDGVGHYLYDHHLIERRK